MVSNLTSYEGACPLGPAADISNPLPDITPPASISPLAVRFPLITAPVLLVIRPGGPTGPAMPFSETVTVVDSTGEIVVVVGHELFSVTCTELPFSVMVTVLVVDQE